MELNSENLIDRCELARRLGFKNPVTIDRMTADGRLPAGMRIGSRSIRWHWPTVLAALAAPKP